MKILSVSQGSTVTLCYAYLQSLTAKDEFGPQDVVLWQGPEAPLSPEHPQ